MAKRSAIWWALVLIGAMNVIGGAVLVWSALPAEPSEAAKTAYYSSHTSYVDRVLELRKKHGERAWLMVEAPPMPARKPLDLFTLSAGLGAIASSAVFFGLAAAIGLLTDIAAKLGVERRKRSGIAGSVMEREPLAGRIGTLGAILAALLIAASPALAKIERNAAVPRAFQRANPCPATGRTSGPCPGWQRDHRVPLACGGADAVENMQWLRIEEARIKDRAALAACRAR